MNDIDRHFLILGLPSTASLAEVKEARILYTKAFHPDRFTKGSEDQRKMEEKQKAINLAYEHITIWFKSGGHDLKTKSKVKEKAAKTKTYHEELDEYMEFLSKSERSPRTLQNIFCDLQSFTDWLGKQGIYGALNNNVAQRVGAYANHQLKLGYSPSTVGRHLFSVRGWLIFCRLDATFVLELTAQLKPKTTSTPKSLTDTQVTKLTASLRKDAKKESRLLIDFLLHTGLTAGEVSMLSWGDVSAIATPGAKHKCVMLLVGGRSGFRNIPLGDKAITVLLELGLNDAKSKAERNVNTPIFTSNGLELSPKMVHYAVTQCGNTAGVAVTPSALRNTFAFRLASAEISREHLAEYMGISEQSASAYYIAPKVNLKDLVCVSKSAQ
jgi:site-specific recombinase XerD